MARCRRCWEWGSGKAQPLPNHDGITVSDNLGQEETDLGEVCAEVVVPCGMESSQLLRAGGSMAAGEELQEEAVQSRLIGQHGRVGDAEQRVTHRGQFQGHQNSEH